MEAEEDAEPGGWTTTLEYLLELIVVFVGVGLIRSLCEIKVVWKSAL